jgi:hypothetical protein
MDAVVASMGPRLVFETARVIREELEAQPG